MTLRRTTSLIIGIALIALISAIYVSSQLFLVRSFEDLEARDMRAHVARAISTLNGQLEAISSIALGYSEWDDTYEYVVDPNPAYIANNMMDLTFLDSNVSIVVLINNDHEIVFEKMVDFETGEEVPVPESLHLHLTPDSVFLNHTDLRSMVNGIVSLPEGHLWLTSQPIVTSNVEGPIRGTQIWGRLIDESFVAKLAEIVDYSVTINRVDTALTEDFDAALAVATDGHQIVVQPLDGGSIAGYTLIEDVYGQPALIMRIAQFRHIFQQGQASLTYFLGALLLAGGAIMIVMLLMVERKVLRPVSLLSSAVARVRETGDLNTSIAVSGSDELGTLAEGIRSMLSALAQSRIRLQEAHDQLEKRVEQRTQELSEANMLLRQEIAERTQMQNALAAARDQAIEALRFKSRILANVSHDARTPLTTIMLRTELAQLGRFGPVTDEQRNTFETIMINARQLLGFVNNLLTEAQLGTDKLQVVHIPFSLPNLITEIDEVMTPLAQRKGLALRIDQAPDLPERIVGDPARVRQILFNLIDNAIKFTERGVVTVSIYRGDAGRWVIRVTDTGRGIPKEAEHRVFEPFWQVDSSMTRDVNRGIGLGLSIVRQLTALLDGEISVTSQVGHGSTFTVVLPLSESRGDNENGVTVSSGRGR